MEEQTNLCLHPGVHIGLYVSVDGDTPIPTILERFARAEAEGFHTAWAGQVFEHDALVLLALASGVTRRIELGTWVLPIQPRHPVALAQQALTVQAACAGRLLLGLGVSHAAVVEKRLGLPYAQPARHMREYLDVLRPLLRGEAVEHEGEELCVSLRLHDLGVAAPSLFLAALGPHMLRLAGERADGVALWLAGPRFLEDHALPCIREGAERAGRATPRTACGLPIAVVSDVHAARTAAERFLAQSSKLPAYRRVLALQELDSPADTAIVGDEETVRAEIRRIEELGISDFTSVLFPIEGDPQARGRTRALLSELAR